MSHVLPRTRDTIVLLLLIVLMAWGMRSYVTGGIMHALFAATGDGAGSIAILREALNRTGPLAPVVYVVAVVLEVLVAPIPGTLLYAPGGALFGGWYGGTLSLAGNVIGAALATWMAATFRARVVGLVERPGLSTLMTRLRDHGLLLIVLLRVNPLTSSDLVSYAAGLVGLPVWRVAAGTLVGMAPLCYAQAHASEWLFGILPGAGIVLIGLGVAYAVVVVWVVTRGRTK